MKIPAILLCFTLTLLHASEPEPPSIHHLVAVKEACAWPALTLLPDGSINATIFGHPSHGSVAGSIEVWNSPDGEVWTKRGIPAPNEPDTNRMNHAAGLAGNGDLIVLCSGWTNVKQPQRPKQADFRDDILSTWVCRSADGGKTWTQIKEFPAPEEGWTHYIPFGDIKRGEDGALHVSCYGGEFADPTQSTRIKSFRSWHFRSDDDGATWRKVSVINPSGDETTILHLGGKRWLAASREKNVAIFRSDDDGATWGEKLDVTDPMELNGQLLRLKDGRILLSYGCRVKDRFGVLGRFSADEGRTWGKPLRIATSLESDCGYPSTVQRADGKLVTGWYAKASPLYESYQMGVSIWEAPAPPVSSAPIQIGGRRELFADHFLIDKLHGTRLQMHAPRDEGVAFAFDKPWEGLFSGYVTIVTLEDGRLRAYYRGKAVANRDGSDEEITCIAESADGRNWTKPELDIHEVMGAAKNNVVLRQTETAAHNFSPFRDERPGVPDDERFKAFGGTREGGGLLAWKSPDGLRWTKMAEKPVIPNERMAPYSHFFDSQNVAFWSSAEGKYVAYYRVFEDSIRRIVRSESEDFLDWTPPVMLGYTNPGMEAPIEQLYTNQTHPYFRAPHLYVAVAARFMPGRQVLDEEQAKAIGVNPGYFKDTSDAIFMTTRPSEGRAYRDNYDRTFLEGYIRGGIGAQNWVSRTNYPALNVVPTGPEEMSVYVNQDYAQPTAHLRRYSLRLDGFSSLHCGYAGGHAITKPLVFSGKALSLNFATSAAGGVKVGFEDADGKPIAGFSIEDCTMQIGNELDRKVAWKSGTDAGSLAGKVVRLRFSMKDADIYSFQFTE